MAGRRAVTGDIALVSMPFAAFDRPSIQIGLLRASGVAHGHRVDTHHLNLDFVPPVGVELYEALSRHRGRLIGEWLFSLDAFGQQAPDQEDDFLDRFWDDLAYIHRLEGVDRERLSALRRDVLPSVLDDLVEGIDWGSYRVVGFTTTFQQNVASFALARRIKARYPRLLILFGGANFEGPMGLEWMRSLPYIDYVISGEADQAFPDLLLALSGGGEPGAIPGVLSRAADGTMRAMPPAPPFQHMDQLPTPDYGEYFERAERLGLLAGKGRQLVTIPFESARGCWWGAKHHCTFCGLNGQTISFRSKSSGRVLGELAELTRRHRSFQFAAVDNIIDMSFWKSLLPALVEERTNYEIFYEIKSNITKQQIRQLSMAGVRHVQPGIESLSTPVLRLMRKGVTAIQNVNVLRWSQYYGVNAMWNLIWGFPGEQSAHYQEQAALLSRLVHLQPPVGWSRIWMERFSPLFRDRAAFPARDLRPEASYTYVYPDTVNLNDTAYFFDYELEGTLEDNAYADTQAAVHAWKAMWDEPQKRPYLVHRYSPGCLNIEDRRDPDNLGNWTFEEPLAQLYMSCSDRPRSAEGVFSEGEAQGLGLHETEWALNAFVERGLMMRDGNSFLCLSLPGTYSG